MVERAIYNIYLTLHLLNGMFQIRHLQLAIWNRDIKPDLCVRNANNVGTQKLILHLILR